MARLVGISRYRAGIAASAQGFNEWRANIFLWTSDASTRCDLRFVDDPGHWASRQRVDERGISLLYLGIERYADVVHLLQTEKPLYVALYGAPSNRAIIQTSQEVPGEEEGS